MLHEDYSFLGLPSPQKNIGPPQLLVHGIPYLIPQEHQIPNDYTILYSVFSG